MQEIVKDGPWVYVAGPYTHPDPVENTNRAIRVADKLADIGFIPVIPHLSLLWHMVTPRPAQWWYDITAEWLKRCDLVYRMSGESKGADAEVALARELGIPVIAEGDGTLSDRINHPWRPDVSAM